MKSDKTNAVRALDTAGMSYSLHPYDPDSGDAVHTAKLLSIPPERLFKTLVTCGPEHRCFVFLVPADRELNNKKAARAAGVKQVSMLPQKELLPTTGYVHGGCSPLGMKKRFPTFLSDTAAHFPTVFFNAGRRGLMIEALPDDLCRMIGASYADLLP